MKKGFTLIELLAVIVILAIIALIATPIVLDIIKDSKNSSNEQSINNYVRAAELTISKKEMNGDVANNSYSLDELKEIGIGIKGKTPTGYDDFIVFGDNGVESYKLTLDGVKYIYANNKKYKLKENEDIEYSITGTEETIEENGTTVYKVGDWKYIVLETGKIQLIEYTGNDTVLMVPGKVNDYEVYAVGVPNVDTSKISEEHKVYTVLGTFDTLEDASDLINFNETIKTIIISSGIEKIDNCAFEGLYALERVILPQTLTYMGNLSISYGGLRSVTIPENVIYLGRSAVGCNFKLKELYYNAISVDSSSYRDTEKGIVYSIFWKNPIEKVVIGENVESLPHYLFYNYFGTLNFEEIVIPENIKSMGWNVFWKCEKLKKVYYNAKNCEPGWKVTQEGTSSRSVFKGTGLSSVIVGKEVERIPYSLFIAVSTLKEITLSTNVKAIDAKAFKNTGLTTVNYNGTKEEFDKITVGDSNTPFTSATINYLK